MEFTAATPAVVARSIEESARGQGSLSALVVPWESDRQRLSMAVTAVKSDGWAIEHTNLGTIALTDLGSDSTRVAIAAGEPDRSEWQPLTTLFTRFARQLQGTLEVTS